MIGNIVSIRDRKTFVIRDVWVVMDAVSGFPGLERDFFRLNRCVAAWYDPNDTPEERNVLE